MPRQPRFALSFALPLVLCALRVHAGDPAASTDSAMRCVQSRMADPLLPVTVNAEQIAQVAIARCADEIETAAADLAATEGHGAGSGRIEAARIAVRRLLLDYALDAAPGAAAIASTSLDGGVVHSLD